MMDRMSSFGRKEKGEGRVGGRGREKGVEEEVDIVEEEGSVGKSGRL